MGTKRALADRLTDLSGFSDPRVALEQYPTPAELAAHLVHLADLQDDLSGRTVVDLGSGTGILALAAACRSADRVVGVEVDAGALAVARENENRVDPGPEAPVHWVLGDAARAPVCPAGSVTVVMNPPFGAQTGREGVDRSFLASAAGFADVSYSIHNAGSQDFVEAFAGDHGGEVTHAYRAAFEVGRQFDHHEKDRVELDVEVFRVDWT